jgi:predicted MFS family arabinose efflux permease
MNSPAGPVGRGGQAPRPAVSPLLAVCPAAFVSLLASISLSPFLSAIAEDLGSTVSLVGQVPSTTMAIATVLGLLVGPLSDHYGHRRALVVGTLAVVGSGLVIALSPGLPMLFLVAVTGGASRAIIVPVSIAIVSVSLDEEASRRAIGRVVVAVAVGMLVGPPLMTAIGASLGWRAAFLALALGGGMATVLVRRLLPTDMSRPGRHLDLRGVLQSYRVIARHRPILGLYGASLLRNTITWTVAIYLGAFLVDRYGSTLPEVGLAFTVAFVGQLVGGYAFGGRIGRVSLRPLLECVYVALGLLFAAFLLLSTDVWLVVGILPLAFFLNGGCDVIEPTLLTGETPGGRATTMTLYGAGESLGSALGGAIGGLLLLLGGFASIGLALPMIGAIAAALVWLSSPRSGAAARQPVQL